MAGITDYLASKVKSLTPEKWDGFVRWIDSRFRVLEEKADITDRVADSILARGLQVIEDGIGPAIIQAEEAAANVKAIADLGMIFTSPSSSSVLIGTGTKTFTIPANRKDQFAPAAVLAVYGGEGFANAIIGATQAYNRDTGVLTVEVIDTIGSGIFSSWTITPVATTRDLEALRDQVQADRLQAGLNAGAAVNAKNDAQSIATDFREKYLGRRATDPTTDGNGNPVSIGALYTNSGSGKLRYYGLSGWQDTTAGSNIVRYEFVTDDRGTAPYSLPEAPASKDNCFVIAGNDPLNGSAFNVSGTDFSFIANPGVGVAVEVKIIAQLAIGTPSDETIDATKIKAAAAAEIRAKINAASASDMLARIPYFGLGSALPTSDIGPIWHETYNSLMTWQSFTANGAALTGYASVDIGRPVHDRILRAGYLKANGADIQKAAYSALFNWARHNGLLVPIGSWSSGPFVFQDNGDGNFRIPDLRGEFFRSADDGRGVDSGRTNGSWQAHMTASHSHGVNDPGHNHGVHDPGHVHGGVQNGQSSTGRSTSVDQPPAVYSFGNTWGATTGIWLSGSGTGISIQAAGGVETRPRNTAFLACIKF